MEKIINWFTNWPKDKVLHFALAMIVALAACCVAKVCGADRYEVMAAGWFAGSSATGAIEKIELETYADPIRRYEIPNDTVKVVRFDNGSKEEVTLDMLIHCANDVTAGLISGAFISRNEYTYLSMSQQRQQRNLLAIQPTDIPLLYLYKLTTAGSTLKWRLIALNFDPWNDEYKMTIHGSPTISNN